MRFVPLNELIDDIYSTEEGRRDRDRLARARRRLAVEPPAERQGYIDRNGTNKWSPLKARFTALLGKKCWYTEAVLVGGDLAVDHFRPKCDYWFLTFEETNYRVACPFANSPHHNEEHGCSGGKGDAFPLLNPECQATDSESIEDEMPVILDPCSREDCDLVAFQADGRPALNPRFDNDDIAKFRLEESKLLLNLDHPDFNAQRERLFHDIKDDAEAYDELAPGSPARETVRTRMHRRLSVTAPFSSAARHYLQNYRHLDWVEEILELTQGNCNSSQDRL